MSSERAFSEGEVPAPPFPAEKARASRRAQLAVAGAAGLAALGAAVAYLYLGAPGLVRTEVLKAIAQRYHRTARLDRVRLDPLRLGADVEGFSLPDRDGRPMIAFRRLHARLSWPSLLLGRIAFEDLTLERPQVRLVRRPDGGLNLADLAPPPDKSKGGPPLALRIARFRLTEGRVEVVDGMRQAPVEKRFDHIAFSLRDFATTANGAAYALAAEGEAGERLRWRGTLGMAPLSSRGRFEFTGWRADRLAAMLPGGLPFTLAAGVLDARGDYDAALRGATPSLRVDLDQAVLKAAAIRPNGAAADPISAAAVTVSGLRLDLAKRAVAIARINVLQPQVSARRAKTGAINLAAFAAPATSGARESGPAWTVAAPDIRITGGRLSFEDRATPEPAAWTASPVDLAIGGFAYPFTAPIQITAHVEADDGSRFEGEGSLAPPAGPGQAPTGAFDVALDGLELNRFQPYVSQAARVEIVSGDAAARGRIELASDGGVRFAGSLSVDNLQAVDPALKSQLVTWDRVEASSIAAASKPFAIKIGRILATGAYGRVVLEPDYRFNIRAVLEQPAPPPKGAAALTLAAAPAPQGRAASRGAAIDLPIDIERIDFVGGRMDFTDLTVQPHFSAGVQDLNGGITGLSARAGARARVDLKGGVDAFAPVAITGSLDPFAADRFLDLAMQFHNMELTTFSPYSGKFAGYWINKGKLDLDLQYRIDAGRLDARHHVVLRDLQLGDKVDSATASKLPIKLIVALLKDRNGVIDLPIDVTGSLDDPKFRIWPVIWKVVGDQFAKIAASPFTLLGELVGHGDGESLGRIVFQPGSAALAPEEAAKIAALGQALAQRPGLAVELPATVAPALDGPVLSEAAYQGALRNAYREAFRRAPAPSLEQVLASPKLKRKLLETAYRQAFGRSPPAPDARGDGAAADALEAALRAQAAAANDRALQALVQARALAVETGLVQVGHVDPRRIFIVAAAPLASGPVAMSVTLR
jgi:uncharacterized protein involved in outer membrane biogenesis